jgi:hypothetical protein
MRPSAAVCAPRRRYWMRTTAVCWPLYVAAFLAVPLGNVQHLWQVCSPLGCVRCPRRSAEPLGGMQCPSAVCSSPLGLLRPSGLKLPGLHRPVTTLLALSGLQLTVGQDLTIRPRQVTSLALNCKQGTRDRAATKLFNFDAFTSKMK